MPTIFSESFINKILFSSFILIVTFIISSLLHRIVSALFARVRKRVPSGYLITKTRTIRSLLKNIADIVLYLLAILMILSNWGVNITPILTGAGIIGLAVSFGSQTLIKDLIGGFFIIFEDQFNVGDKVRINNVEGEVERVTMRLTVLRDKDGNNIYIPNSQVNVVTRYRKVTAPKVKIIRARR
ncbi:mechanosensitive ion channel [Candidatus Roizmanbacteria bacterium]|nr:mechanosensitive ion channel [Candidatus Roizmanbacteria bacterium]